MGTGTDQARDEARLVTSGVRGVFLELATREEFIKLVVAPPTTLV